MLNNLYDKPGSSTTFHETELVGKLVSLPGHDLVLLQQDLVLLDQGIIVCLVSLQTLIVGVVLSLQPLVLSSGDDVPVVC